MLVMSSVAQSASKSTTSAPWPLSIAMSICRTDDRHLGESCSTVAAVVMTWPALAWLVMRFAVCTVAPNTSRFSSTTGPKWQPIANRDRLAVHLELRMLGDLLLHLRGGIQGVVGSGEGRHDLIAHGLDDRAVILFGGAAHHVDADRDHIARAQVAHELIKTGRADHVGEQYGELGVFAHAVTPRSEPRRILQARKQAPRDYTRPTPSPLDVSLRI